MKGEDWVESLQSEQQKLSSNVEVSVDKFVYTNVSTVLEDVEEDVERLKELDVIEGLNFVELNDFLENEDGLDCFQSV